MNMSLNFHHLLLILTILLAFAYLQTDASVGRKDSPQEGDDWKDIDPNNPKVVEAQMNRVRDFNANLRIFLQASDGKYLDRLWLKPLEDNKEEEEKRRREEGKGGEGQEEREEKEGEVEKRGKMGMESARRGEVEEKGGGKDGRED
ncbi:hypothetical protein ACH5RR_014615 [Cinchona calisaya]|uniref:Uncharacterized protein n=1 Tax=Cinchona calisaya TaxID=153742 RepID=A0ABD2ZQR8_9GENT